MNKTTIFKSRSGTYRVLQSPNQESETVTETASSKKLQTNRSFVFYTQSVHEQRYDESRSSYGVHPQTKKIECSPLLLYCYTLLLKYQLFHKPIASYTCCILLSSKWRLYNSDTN